MNSRSMSMTLNYVLVLSISAVLITGIIIAGGTFVENQRKQVIEGELRIIGNHLAGNLEQVDRYVRAGSGTTSDAYINQTFGTDATGSTYGVQLDERSETTQVVLNSTSPDVSVRVNASVQTDVNIADSYADGGTISVAYDEGSDELVIHNA